MSTLPIYIWFQTFCITQECLFVSWALTIYWGCCSAFYGDTKWGRWPRSCTPVCLIRCFQPAQHACISSQCSAVHNMQSDASKPARVVFIAGSWFGAYEINKQVIFKDWQGSCQLEAILFSSPAKSFWHGGRGCPLHKAKGALVRVRLYCIWAWELLGPLGCGPSARRKTQSGWSTGRQCAGSPVGLVLPSEMSICVEQNLIGEVSLTCIEDAKRLKSPFALHHCLKGWGCSLSSCCPAVCGLIWWIY